LTFRVKGWQKDAKIEIYRDGILVAEGYTDIRGRFAVQLEAGAYEIRITLPDKRTITKYEFIPKDTQLVVNIPPYIYPPSVYQIGQFEKLIQITTPEKVRTDAYLDYVFKIPIFLPNILYFQAITEYIYANVITEYFDAIAEYVFANIITERFDVGFEAKTNLFVVNGGVFGYSQLTEVIPPKEVKEYFNAITETVFANIVTESFDAITESVPAYVITESFENKFEIKTNLFVLDGGVFDYSQLTEVVPPKELRQNFYADVEITIT